MHLINVLLSFIAIFAAAEAALKNTTREFHLKTVLKPNQPGKARFNDLWFESYHTGAGESDVTLTSTAPGIKGFLNGTNGKVDGTTYQNVVFDLGDSFGWTLDMAASTNFYAAWEPVEINAGGGASAPHGYSGFWINETTGLQWTDALNKPPDYKFNQFEGWLVCNWWHGVPQLFFRIDQYPHDVPAPCSCAGVYVMPEYI